MSNEYRIEILIDTFLKQTQTPMTLSEILLVREMFGSFANSFNESKLRIISTEQPKPQAQTKPNAELKQQKNLDPVSPTREELLAQLNKLDAEEDDDEPVPEIDDLEEDDVDVKKSLEDMEAELLAERKKKQNSFTSRLNNLAKARKNEQTADYN